MTRSKRQNFFERPAIILRTAAAPRHQTHVAQQIFCHDFFRNPVLDDRQTGLILKVPERTRAVKIWHALGKDANLTLWVPPKNITAGPDVKSQDITLRAF